MAKDRQAKRAERRRVRAARKMWDQDPRNREREREHLAVTCAERVWSHLRSQAALGPRANLSSPNPPGGILIGRY
ncbi:hypothetical protein [Pseudactinotalea sp. Z1748]|uniref:hypothetical protein n=1 Tax=Pseudactinotalea sp. Z1748 TaxID=3413027 RepID=UPI003C79C897